jgi:hypothetical protein
LKAGEKRMTITEQTLTRVSFAVRLEDDFSGRGHLVHGTKVHIEENGRMAFENPSMYQVFTGVLETNVTIQVENKYYFPKRVSVDIPGLDARNPVVKVTMKPNCLYPFPAGSTLVRGVILDAGSHGAEGAQVSVAGSTVTNESGGDGRFVLYWRPLEEDDVAVVNNHRHLKIGGGTTIQLNVSHAAFAPKTVIIGTVVEGELKLLTAPIILNP